MRVDTAFNRESYQVRSGSRLIFSGLFFAASFLANAGLVDVAFYSSNYSTTPAPTGAAFLGQPGDVWNWLNVGNPSPAPSNLGTFSLVDTTGAATGASVSAVADGGVTSLATGTQPVPDLTDNYLFENDGGPIDVTLSGLAPDTAYSLVLYVASDDSGGGARALTGTANGIPFTATGDPQSTFVPGLNIVDLPIVTSDATGAISIAENAAARRQFR
jgi:hypothetical protein